MSKAKRDIKRKLRILNYAKKIGNIRKTCRYFGISRAGFYLWKNAYEKFGLVNAIPISPHSK
jgi:hypothetical protein